MVESDIEPFKSKNPLLSRGVTEYLFDLDVKARWQLLYSFIRLSRCWSPVFEKR